VEWLPRGAVVAVDGSPAMAQQARARLGPGVDVRVADLTELELEAPVDAVLQQLDEPAVEYVRLNLLARRPT